MSVTRIAVSRPRRIASTAAALMVLGASLTGCGPEGGGHDGTYLLADDDRLLTMEVGGDQVKSSTADCLGKVVAGSELTGELSDDAATVVWTTAAGDSDASNAVEFTDTTMNIDGEQTFYREGSDEGKNVRQTFDDECAAVAAEETQSVEEPEGTEATERDDETEGAEATEGGTEEEILASGPFYYLDPFGSPSGATLIEVQVDGDDLLIRERACTTEDGVQAYSAPVSSVTINADDGTLTVPIPDGSAMYAGAYLTFSPEGSEEARDAKQDFSVCPASADIWPASGGSG